MLTQSAHYCCKCHDYCDIEVVMRDETYRVLDKVDVSITAPVATCTKCGNDVADHYLDDEALGLAYARYESMTGNPIAKRQ